MDSAIILGGWFRRVSISQFENEGMVRETRDKVADPAIMVSTRALYISTHWLIPAGQSSQEAIVKGAAIRGLLNMQPTTRLARRNYGYDLDMPFREEVDEQRLAYVCPWQNAKYCRSRIEWFLRKGEPLEDLQVKKLSMYCCSKSRHFGSSNFSILTCDDESPPDYMFSAGVAKIGEFEVEWTDEDIASAKRKKVGPSTYRNIGFEVVVKLFSERGDFQISALVNGDTREGTTMKFEQDYSVN